MEQTETQCATTAQELTALFSPPIHVRASDPWLNEDGSLWDVVFPRVKRDDGVSTITYVGLIEREVRNLAAHKCPWEFVSE